MDIPDDYLESSRKRFEPRVKKSDSCWIWTGGKDWNGYGMFWFGDNNIGASKFALMLTGIKIPDDRVVCHKCDNPSCVRPSHLFVGTQKDNVQDSIRKGRRVRNHTSITTKTAKQIGELLSSGMTCDKIAQKLGIKECVVEDIRCGRTFKDVVTQNWLKGNRVLSKDQVHSVIWYLQNHPEFTARQIASILSISIHSINKISTKEGYKEFLGNAIWRRPKGMRPKSCQKLIS